MDEAIRVLHVDDDTAFADLTAELLEQNDDHITVRTETSANDGLDRLAAEEIDCIVSDYDMPEANGIEFLRTVRQRHPELPFVLFTGKGSEEIAAEAVEAGVSGYLQKNGTDTFELLASRIRQEVTDSRITSSYREYKTVVESLTDPVYVTDEDGCFSEVNEAFLELTGYDEEAIIGSHVSLMKGEEGTARAEANLGRILSSKGPDDILFEVDIRTADGRTIPCEDHMGVVPFEGEQFRGSVGVLRDLSERREDEQLRRELYDITTGSDLGFEAKCRRLLQVGCKRLGLEEGKLNRIDLANEEYRTIITAHDRNQDGTAAELATRYRRHVAGSGELIAIHHAGEQRPDDPAYRGDGSECYIGVEVNADGSPYGTVCFFDPEPRTTAFTNAEQAFVELVGRLIERELERKQAEEDRKERERTLARIHEIVADRERSHTERIERLLKFGRTLLETDYATVSRVEGDQYVIEEHDAEPGAEELVTVGETVPLSGTFCERTVIERETQAAARLTEDATFADHPARRESGFECYIGTPLYRGGEVYGTLCFLDRSERERPFSEWETTVVELLGQWVSYALEERRNRAALERERDRLDEFAGVVSHDLRNPLRVARGRIDLSRQERTDPHLDDAVDALERADRLIEDLLTLSQEGRIVDGLKPVSLADVTKGAWASATPESATLDVRTDEGINADPERLRQLLENLLGNAIEHGGEDVTVTVETIPGGFAVSDDGPGVPEAERSKVFETGYSTSDDGTGFGLGIVKRIAEAHGWEIRLREGENGGARFEITGVGSTST